MTLEEYTNLEKTSFCYWLEAITSNVGSIWGGSAYKFGIYKRRDISTTITVDNRITDGEYAWFQKYGTTRDEAFQTVKKIIISLDRLDYTKGIPQRIQAFARFLDLHPEYIGLVTLVLVVIPSRSQVTQYRDLKKTLNTLVSEVNSTYGSFGWIPIHYLYRNLLHTELLALYQVADIALITPLRDGSGGKRIYSE